MQTAFTTRTALLAATVGFALTVALPSYAQSAKGVPSKEQLIEALRLDKPATPAKGRPKMKTRGIELDDEETSPTAGAQAATTSSAGIANQQAQPAMPDKLEMAQERQPQQQAQQRPAAQQAQAQQVAQKPAVQQKSIDLDIPFDFNSDRMTATGAQILDSLGEALNSEALRSVKAIVLEGHTDAVGGASYNLQLSQRRAEAARKYLGFKFRIPTDKVQAQGKGSFELADPSKPTDAVNRRVRVIVMG
jgi:outer membrane protein OmpA-like peptidoglycan-associated protein